MITVNPATGDTYLSRTPTMWDISVLRRYVTTRTPWTTPADAGITSHVVELLPQAGRDRVVLQITIVPTVGPTIAWYSVNKESAGTLDVNTDFYGNRTATTNLQPVLLKTDANPLILKPDRYLNMTVVHAAGAATSGTAWITYCEV